MKFRIIIDEHLSFKTHIESVKQKITWATARLAELRHYVPLRILKSAHLTLFDSHMKQGCQIWGQNNKSHITKLEEIQNKADNTLKFDRYSPNSSKLFNDLGICPRPNKQKLAWCLWKLLL